MFLIFISTAQIIFSERHLNHFDSVNHHHSVLMERLCQLPSAKCQELVKNLSGRFKTSKYSGHHRLITLIKKSAVTPHHYLSFLVQMTYGALKGFKNAIKCRAYMCFCSHRMASTLLDFLKSNIKLNCPFFCMTSDHHSVTSPPVWPRESIH